MLPQVLLLLVAHISTFVFAKDTPLSFTRIRRASQRNVPPEGFYDPRTNGGTWLTTVPHTFPEGMGEPINAVLSGHSDPEVLKDAETDGGFRNYMLSVGQALGGFASECLGQHTGNNQGADLGDGKGNVNESAVLRWNYGDPQLGTCKESIAGGNHFRYWVQDGEKANSGAIFMAASLELPIAQGHDIKENGYNLARDELVGNATAQTSNIDTTLLTNGSTYTGSSQYAGYMYQTSVVYTAGYADNTSVGINHNYTVGGLGKFNAIDGLVAVMTVRISSRPAGARSAASQMLSFSPALGFSTVVAALVAALL